MDPIARNPDAASRLAAPSGPGAEAAASRRRAAAPAETAEPAGSQTTVTLTRRAQELAALDAPEGSGRTGSNAAQAPQEQAGMEQMAQINAQLRRTYMGAGGAG